MSVEHWELEVTPTAQETYEAMTSGGRALLRRKDHALLFGQSIFIGMCAPVGATIILWVTASLSGGPAIDELPVAAIPVSVLIFGMLTFWLIRQTHFMIAQAAVRSRFGRSQQVVLESTGITLITRHSRWYSGWADVGAVRGSKNVLVVCISGIAIALPRRAFADPFDADHALASMQQWKGAT